VTPREFFRLSAGYPVNPLGATAQCAHETGRFSHIPGGTSHNLAGIKATRSWIEAGGPSVDARTGEFSKGNAVTVTGAFRVYGSTAAFLADYSRIINAYYHTSARNRDCVWGYLAGLHGRWATDPGYYKGCARMAVELAPQLLGEGWAARLESSLRLAERRGSLAPWMLGYTEGLLGIEIGEG
jgi:hypothetical protein